MPWPIEEIADDDDLYRRLASHTINWKDKTVNYTAFTRSSRSKPRQQPDPDISVDLARLTTPERCIAQRPTHGVGAVVTRFPRRSLSLTVVHTPDQATGNRAHSSIRDNEGERALENCYRMAEELTKRVLIYPQQPAEAP